MAIATNLKVPVTGNYVWLGMLSNGARATMSIDAAGPHTVNVWMRESGTVINKVLVTTAAAFNPATVNGDLGLGDSVWGNSNL